MKILLPVFSCLFWLATLLPTSASSGEIDLDGAIASLENIDAIQAMEIANQWKWTNNSIKTSVNPQVVIFKFPNGLIKEIPLPMNKMVVAIAPYIRKTHG